MTMRYPAWMNNVDIEDDTVWGTIKYFAAVILTLLMTGIEALIDILLRPFRHRKSA